jgi:hypothetical protein
MAEKKVRGEKVVDLWAGRLDYPNDSPPWEQNTIVNIFSASKVVVIEISEQFKAFRNL